MKKIYQFLAAAALISAIMCKPAFAEVHVYGDVTVGWRQLEGGIKWKYSDDSYASPGWHWLNECNWGSNDLYQYAQCYYFDQDGYLVTNTTTPDGYTVNETGAWTVDGVVQSKKVESGEENGIIIRDKTAADFDTSFLGGNDPLYNEYGISRTAISMLASTREENAKYGEISATFGGTYSHVVTYSNGFTVKYNDPLFVNGEPLIMEYDSIELDMSHAVMDASVKNTSPIPTGVDGTIFLKYYFPNHQFMYDRVADSKEKWSLFKEFGFPVKESDVSFYVDEVQLSFYENGQKYQLIWYCDNRIIMYKIPDFSSL